MATFSKPEDRMMEILQRMSSIPIMNPPKESPLSMPQAMMLNWVARVPGCGVLDIAKGLNVTPPTVSVGIRRLIKGNWLEQRHDPHDRRTRPIYLTEKGNSFVAAMNQHSSEMLKRFLSGLTDEEKEQLIGLLDRAVSALETTEIHNPMR
jgi:DNA-binding MarR family transcriptional regulator